MVDVDNDLEILLRDALAQQAAKPRRTAVFLPATPTPRPPPKLNPAPARAALPPPKWRTESALAVFITSACHCGATCTTFSHYAYKQRSTSPPVVTRIARIDGPFAPHPSIPLNGYFLRAEVPLCLTCAGDQGWNIAVTAQGSVSGNVVSAAVVMTVEEISPDAEAQEGSSSGQAGGVPAAGP